jgi:hypothetical protein
VRVIDTSGCLGINTVYHGYPELFDAFPNATKIVGTVFNLERTAPATLEKTSIKQRYVLSGEITMDLSVSTGIEYPITQLPDDWDIERNLSLCIRDSERSTEYGPSAKSLPTDRLRSLIQTSAVSVDIEETEFERVQSLLFGGPQRPFRLQAPNIYLEPYLPDEDFSSVFETFFEDLGTAAPDLKRLSVKAFRPEYWISDIEWLSFAGLKDLFLEWPLNGFRCEPKQHYGISGKNTPSLDTCHDPEMGSLRIGGTVHTTLPR